MTAHVDPNSAHATYAPSSAKRWMNCTASAEAIAHLPEQETNEAAAEGTEAHEELERVLKGGAPDPDHPAAYGIALAVSYVNQLPAGKMWIEERVILTEQIWGRCDVAHWHEETGVLTIVDLKNGYVGVDAEDNEQLQIYAAATIYTHKLPAKSVRLVIVQPHDFRPLPRVKQAVISAEALFEFASKAAAIPGGPKSFKAGQHCTYCNLFGRCEASRDLLALLSVAMQHTPDDVPLATRATFKALEKPLVDWFKGADKTWTKDALTGKIGEGMKLVTAQKHMAWKSEAEARASIVAKLGVDALDPPTPAQAKKLGLSDDEIATMAARPDGGPALAFESDKRPAWAPKSATEMFKDVPALKG